eukprot:s775_g6.t1
MSNVEGLPRPRKRLRQSPEPSGWGSAAHDQVEAADGPRTMKESDMWPDTALKALNEYGFLTQLTANLERGLRLTSDYNGVGTVEESATCLCITLQKHCTTQGSGNPCSPSLFVGRVGDYEPDCRSVLLSAYEQRRAACPAMHFWRHRRAVRCRNLAKHPEES